ncbi:hypothetical protein VTH06DRAFT_5211 [Thermothelomyces fergusii]
MAIIILLRSMITKYTPETSHTSTAFTLPRPNRSQISQGIFYVFFSFSLRQTGLCVPTHFGLAQFVMHDYHIPRCDHES